MKKPKSLRAALTAALPEFRNEPSRMALWVENGRVKCRQTATHGFAMEYPLSILLTEMTTDIAVAMHAVNRWLRVHQPDLLSAASDGFTFETDVLDNQSADVMMTIPICENISVTDADDGGYVIDYLPEPDPLFDDDTSLVNPDPAPPLAEVRTTAEIIAD